jgi:Dihydrofolate reductase
MEKIIIVAVAENGVIGSDGDLPWNPIEEDMEFFREKTTGSTVIMGRKTFQSLPESVRPLPERQNIVLTRSGFEPEGAEVAGTLDEAWSKAGNEKVFVIGGASVYRQALPEAEKMLITEVKGEYGGDTFFPEFSEEEWKEVERRKGEEVEFVIYSSV